MTPNPFIIEKAYLEFIANEGSSSQIILLGNVTLYKVFQNTISPKNSFASVELSLLSVITISLVGVIM